MSAPRERKSCAQAAEWYYKAADQGYERAQYSFGNLCRDGRGVEQYATDRGARAKPECLYCFGQ